MQLLARFGPIRIDKPLSQHTFVELTEQFPEYQMEREKNGIVIIMSPGKKGSGQREFELQLELGLWFRQYNQGQAYGSNTGFTLPDGSTKCPDAAWISPARLAEYSSSEKDEDDFVHVVPDFVVELRSSTDRLTNLKKKMVDTWLKNGVRLAWLIDPYDEKVYIYRPDQDVEVASQFDKLILSADDVLPGFNMPLAKFKAG